MFIKSMDWGYVVATPLLLALLMLTGCSTTIYPIKVYPEGGSVMEGQFAHDWSGSGEVRFTHSDGEKFTGQYTTVSPQVFQTSFTTLIVPGSFGALVPTVGSTSTNMFYGLTSLAGDRCTSADCKYIGNITGFLSFNCTGACQDSKGRQYTMHMQSGSGAKFDDETKTTEASAQNPRPRETPHSTRFDR